MLFLSIVHHYLTWHYSRAFLEIFHVWLNLMWFVVHFFSIPLLLRSLFSPWKRISEGRGDKWSLEDLAGYLVIGLVSRIIGFVLRLSIIVVGLISLFIVVFGGFAVYVFWLAAPLVIIGLLASGITLLIA
jgi:hypothetical protein